MSDAAAAPKPRFQFGGSNVKCRTCSTTVYQQEKIDYDGVSYHQSCFKCLSCKSTMSLGQVAQINGDLYCKNCFKRIFTREGKYSSFGDKAGEERGRSGTVLPASTSSDAATSTTPAATTAAPAERRGSVVLPCVVADCKQPRLPRKNYCLEHNNLVADAGSSSFTALTDAIAAKNVDKVKDILSQEKSAAILFQLNARGQTPIELAFTGIQNSRACGQAMLDWLQKRLPEADKPAAASSSSSSTETASATE